MKSWHVPAEGPIDKGDACLSEDEEIMRFWDETFSDKVLNIDAGMLQSTMHSCAKG